MVIKICKTIREGEVQRIEYCTPQGKISKKEDYENGILKLRRVYVSDNQYDLVETFNQEEISVGRTETWYNENNQIEKEESAFGEKCYYHYDDDQRLLSVKTFDSENNIESILEYSYDGNDEYFKCFDSSGILMSLTITTYDETKRPVRRIYFEKPDYDFSDADKSEGFEVFFEMIKMFSVDAEGNKVDIRPSIYFLEYEVFFEYDQFGNAISEETFFYDDERSINALVIKSGNYNSYDENNLLIKNHFFDIKTDWDDEGQCLYKYVLNEKGVVIEKSTDSGFNKIIEKFNYNNDGKLISYIENRNNDEQVKEILYDDFGNKIFEISKSNFDGEYEEEITKYEIEYY